MASIELKKLVKRYEDTEVLHSIDLAIKNKEFVVLVGPSGCGKSTTLRLIAGLEELSSGEIFIGNRCVDRLPPKDRDIAMVFQNYALYPHMNVFDNMSFSLKIQGQSKAERLSRVKEAAEILGLTPYLNRRPGELSGGQRQRVAMGRAIVRKPSVFLFDEPLSNLDAKLRSQMRAEIKKLHQRLGCTIVYVTHDQVEAMTLADRIVLMKDGYVEQVGSPEEIYQKPANTFVASFMGNPPMNILSLEKTDGSLSLEGQKLPFKSFQNPSTLMGIRPESLSLTPDSQKQKIQGTVDLKEALGATTLLHVSLDRQSIVAHVDGLIPSEEGDSVDLYYRPQDCHFFNENDQNRLESS